MRPRGDIDLPRTLKIRDLLGLKLFTKKQSILPPGTRHLHCNSNILALDLLQHITGRLSISAGDDVFAPRCSHTGARECSPQEDLKPSKSGVHVGVSLLLRVLDTESINKHHGTSPEPLRSSGDDAFVSPWLTLW